MTKRHISALTGIRGFAAIWVLLHHLVSQSPFIGNNYHWVEVLAQKGWLGVDLFFILSGFVISYVYHDDFSDRLTYTAYRRFLILRFARVYPVHIFTTLALIPIYLTASYLFSYESLVNAFSLEKLLYSITLTNGIGIENSVGWNVPSWSVSAECFAYLLFPLVTWLVYSRQMSIFTCIYISAAILITTIMLGLLQSDMTQYMLPWSGTLVRISAEFSLGCLLYNIYKQLPDQFYNHYANFAFACLILLIGLNLPSQWDFLFLLSFIFLVFGLTNNDSLISSMMSHRVCIYLGEISYSIYLSHTIVFMVLGALYDKFIPAEYFHTGVIAFIYIVTVIAVSHILFNVIEKKSRDMIKNIFLYKSRTKIEKNAYVVK